ncbi:MAG: hypothetical protein KAI83_10515 [Thiomargarita sp.]|nr:hypothetical protein [Thiomargarita sp.]
MFNFIIIDIVNVERRVGRGTKPTFSYDENKWWVSRSLYPPYFKSPVALLSILSFYSPQFFCLEYNELAK